MAKVEASPELVRLGTDGRGQERFTTREMLATEQRMEQAAATLAARQDHRVDLRRRLMESTTLGREQVLAFRHVTQAQDLSVVVGYAGTGKSTMLGEARAAWEADGYQVRGAALSGIAAELSNWDVYVLVLRSTVLLVSASYAAVTSAKRCSSVRRATRRPRAGDRDAARARACDRRA